MAAVLLVSYVGVCCCVHLNAVKSIRSLVHRAPTTTVTSIDFNWRRSTTIHVLYAQIQYLANPRRMNSQLLIFFLYFFLIERNVSIQTLNQIGDPTASCGPMQDLIELLESRLHPTRNRISIYSLICIIIKSINTRRISNEYIFVLYLFIFFVVNLSRPDRRGKSPWSLIKIDNDVTIAGN